MRPIEFKELVKKLNEGRLFGRVNPAEQAAVEAIRKRGYLVLSRGWPDLMAIDPDRGYGFAVEVKQGKDKLSDYQRAMHYALSCFGISLFTLRPPFKELESKRGRAFLTGGIKTELLERIDALERLRKSVEKQIEELREDVTASSVLIEPVPPEAQPIAAINAAAEEFKYQLQPEADALSRYGAFEMAKLRAADTTSHRNGDEIHPPR